MFLKKLPLIFSCKSEKFSKTEKGLVLAWDRGLLVKNVKLINFPDANSYAIGATEISGRCE